MGVGSIGQRYHVTRRSRRARSSGGNSRAGASVAWPLTLPPNADHDLHGKAPHLQATVQRWRTTDWQLFEPRTFAAGRLRKLHGYLGNVSHVDHAVGEFLQFLDDAGNLLRRHHPGAVHLALAGPLSRRPRR